MKKIGLLFSIITLVVTSVSAQRSTRAKDADFSFLKGEKSLNIIFTYEGMTVGKNMTEEDYVAKKVSDKNAKKKGKGDEWKASWEKGKLSIYEPMFKNIFTKKLGKIGIQVTEGDDAPITIIVKTTRIEPGFNIGISNANAIVDFEMIFVETADQDNIISQIVMNKVYGEDDAYAVSDRVKVAYLAAGRRLSGYIAKRLKK